MLGAGAQTGRVRLTSGLDVGDLYVNRGDLVHAESDGAIGDAAFARLLSWPSGSFAFEPGITPIDRTIEKTLEVLVAESIRMVQEREAIRRVIPSTDAIPRLVRNLATESVTVDASDWRILSRMDGRTSIAVIADELGVEEADLVRQLVRLKGAGLFELEIVEQQRKEATAQRQLAGPQFFQALTSAVADAMGPLAEVIIDDAVEEMGCTRATLPREAVSHLCERIAAEIRDDEHRVRFQQTILSMLRSRAA
jgi:DNA-binding MarR family transcriptional regulator